MSLVSTVSTIRTDGRLFIRYLKCSTQMSFVSTVSTIRINSGLIRINSNPDLDGRLFIQYSKCSTQICINSVDNLNAEFSHLIEPQTPVSTVSTNIALNVLHALIFVSTVSTNIALNVLHALIFVSTVSTNKIPYSIHNSIALIFCIDSVDKQDTLLNTQ